MMLSVVRSRHRHGGGAARRRGRRQDRHRRAAPDRGGPPDPKNTDAWFVAFAPARSPKVAVAVMLVGAGAGGKAAAPIAREVLQRRALSAREAARACARRGRPRGARGRRGSRRAPPSCAAAARPRRARPRTRRRRPSPRPLRLSTSRAPLPSPNSALSRHSRSSGSQPSNASRSSRFSGSPCFARRREPQRPRDHLAVEERHARLEAVGHRHPVAALQVEVVQRAHGALELGVQLGGVGELAHVVVAGEQLVGALAGEHDLDVLAGHAGEHEVRHGAAHEAGVEGLDRAHDVGQRLERLGRGVGDLVVLGADVLGDPARGGEVGRVRGPDRERLQAPAALVASRAAIAATSDESSPPDRNTPTGTSPIICRSTARRAPRACRPAAPRGRSTGALRGGHGGGEAHQAVLGRPRAAGRERLDERLPLGVEGVHLGREADRAVAPRPVQRLDPDRVARGDEAPVAAGHDEREHAVQLGRAPRRRARRAGAARPRCRRSSAARVASPARTSSWL